MKPFFEKFQEPPKESASEFQLKAALRKEKLFLEKFGGRAKEIARIFVLISSFVAAEEIERAVLAEETEASEIEKTNKITEDFILSPGVELNSSLWKKIKNGEIEGVGKTKKEWKEYLSRLEVMRKDFLKRLSRSVRAEMEKYPFKLRGLGGGGAWETSLRADVVLWDDFSDMENVNFEGVGMLYSKDYSPDETTIVHEYFHGIWDVYGALASKETRVISKEQFRRDTERFIQYKTSSIVRSLRESWGLNRPDLPGRLKRLIEIFPDDYSPLDTIPQSLNERFARLAEIYFVEPNNLPDYIKQHFEPFLKE